MPFDLSRLPDHLRKRLAHEAAGLAAVPDAIEFLTAPPVTLWSITVNHMGLPVLDGRIIGPDWQLANVTGILLVLRPDRYARTQDGWLHLGAHATETDPRRLADLVTATGTQCDELRASLLGEDRP